MRTKKVKPPIHVVRARAKLLAVLSEVGKDVTDTELLALLSYTVGQCLALQDQRSLTPEQGLDLINQNIQQGNLDAVSNLLTGAPAGSA